MSTQPKPALFQGGDAAHILHPPTSSDTFPESQSTTNAFHLSIRIISYVLLHILLKAFVILQVCSAAAHEHICRFFALPPCQVHGPRESAIVIVDGDQGELFRLNAIEAAFSLAPWFGADLPCRTRQAYRFQFFRAGLHRLRVVSRQTCFHPTRDRCIERVFGERDLHSFASPLPSVAENLASSAHSGMAHKDQKVRPLHFPLGFACPHRVGHDFPCAADPCVRDCRRLLRHPHSLSCCGHCTSRAEFHQYVGVHPFATPC